jgi:lipopolysaccharide transport system ATP-binding protein
MGHPVGSSFSPSLVGIKRGELKTFMITIQSPNLAPGNYYLGVAVGVGDHKTGYINYDVVHDVLYFNILHEVSEGGVLAIWSKTWGEIVFQPLGIEEANQ